jgi:hypothetical protein
MSGRPRNARGLTGRDGGKESDLEADLLARIVESVRKAAEEAAEADRCGKRILELESKIKADGNSMCYAPQRRAMRD